MRRTPTTKRTRARKEMKKNLTIFFFFLKILGTLFLQNSENEIKIDGNLFSFAKKIENIENEKLKQKAISLFQTSSFQVSRLCVYQKTKENNEKREQKRKNKTTNRKNTRKKIKTYTCVQRKKNHQMFFLTSKDEFKKIISPFFHFFFFVSNKLFFIFNSTCRNTFL